MSDIGQNLLDPFCDKPKQKSCSNCGASFTCGAAVSAGAGTGACWCEELPHVSLVAAADQDCLCPECLGHAIAKSAATQKEIMVVSSANKTANSPPSLVEGEDYYCEGAAIVFTARYLLRRGYCCESGCRHCPYPQVKKLLPDNLG